MRPIHLAAAAAALLLAPGVAPAQDRAPCGPDLVCASDPDTVMHAMEKAGLKPTRSADNEGDPVISSEEAAYPFDVYFYGCEQHKHCDSLRFQVTFRKDADNTAALANKWNLGKRFLQASVPADGRFVVAYDVGTIGGVNQRNFADTLDWWQSMLGELGDFFAAELKLKPKG
jgi:Putative bacterial sensory transduction regulator